MAAVRLENITKKFAQCVVLDKVSFELKRNELLVVLGPSGCGKTTTLRLIAGLETPDSGRVYIDDNVVSTPDKILGPEKRRVGMVFQDLALWPHMNVFENIEFGLKEKKLSQKERKHEIDRVLSLLGLTQHAHLFPQNLSGGEKQRVALARTLVLKPEVLLLDEPLLNLDFRLKENLLAQIRELKNSFGVSIIYVTHEQEEALDIADRVVVINNGRIQQVGTPENIYLYPENGFVACFVGVNNILSGEITEPGLVETKIGRLKCNNRTVSGRVKLAVRPENFVVNSRGPVRAKVVKCIFKGSRLLYEVECSELSLKVESRHRVKIGEEVGLELISEAVVLKD